MPFLNEVLEMLFLILLFMNALTEYLLNKIMLEMNILEKKNLYYHVFCSVLRIIWLYLCAWFAIPIPVLLVVLLALLFLNVLPYRSRTLMMNNFTMLIFLIYASLLMMAIGCVGLLGIDVARMTESSIIKVLVLNVSFLFFDLISFLLLRFQPDFLWKEDYDRLKVVNYTLFLLACSIYHIFDALILTLYDTGQINYLLLILGDILVLILMFNFLNYNHVFAKDEEMKKEYVKNEVLLAQQYFEKEALKQLSEFDALTNAYNRREISSIMLDAINNEHKIICVFIDLDGLKHANDTYGHTFGDLMLKRFVEACSEIIEEKGHLARIGGDEFLLVFLNQEISEIENCVNMLQIKLLAPPEEKDRISFSYGISCDEETVEDYIKMADQKMYECKNRKRRGIL